MSSGRSAGLRALTLRATLFAATGDLIPYYALYALLFADHGFGPGQISLLLALWSVTAFVCEIPSGAWADTVSRRGLLILNGLLMAVGFLLWTLAPSFLGFAAGFVLWGVASALRSGTFEALLYDELTVRGESRAYARVIGYTRSASELSAVLAILAATPLYLWGGYELVGWASVGCAIVHTALARSLPAAPRSVSAAEVGELEEAGESEAAGIGVNESGAATSPEPGATAPREPGATAQPEAGATAPREPGATAQPEAGATAIREPREAAVAEAAETTVAAAGETAPARAGVSHRGVTDPAVLTPSPRPATADPATSGSGSIRRYLYMLRTGVTEAVRIRVVRRGVVLLALLYGITAFDEYFGLLAGAAGATTAVVPVLVGVTVVGSLLGSLLAGRTEAMSARTMARALYAAAVLFGAGALIAGAAVHRPGATYILAAAGFVALAASYGIVYNSAIVAEARLQDAITGPARATVMSVAGLSEELISLAVFGFVGLMTLWLPMSSTLALLGIGLAAIAVLSGRWLPPQPRVHDNEPQENKRSSETGRT
ncbi:MFS transporter [Nocardia sp. CA-290969]|uniref:MFS transporter n=1 Tax=Nocardia sp. CA-290969 TaxID=3239986 RepID=UPI003D89DB08